MTFFHGTIIFGHFPGNIYTRQVYVIVKCRHNDCSWNLDHISKVILVYTRIQSSPVMYVFMWPSLPVCPRIVVLLHQN